MRPLSRIGELFGVDVRRHLIRAFVPNFKLVIIVTLFMQGSNICTRDSAIRCLGGQHRVLGTLDFMQGSPMRQLGPALRISTIAGGSCWNGELRFVALVATKHLALIYHRLVVANLSEKVSVIREHTQQNCVFR